VKVLLISTNTVKEPYPTYPIALAFKKAGVSIPWGGFFTPLATRTTVSWKCFGKRAA
jgi:hypothetical protein